MLVVVTILKENNKLHQDSHLYFIAVFVINIIIIMIFLKMNNDIYSLDKNRVKRSSIYYSAAIIFKAIFCLIVYI